MFLMPNFLIQESEYVHFKKYFNKCESREKIQGNHSQTRKFRWLEHFFIFNSFPGDEDFIITHFTFANVVLLAVTYSKMVVYSSSFFSTYAIIKHH